MTGGDVGSGGSALSRFWRPYDSLQFRRQLRGLYGIEKTQIASLARLQFFLWRSDNKPERFCIRIIENLPQHRWANQDTPVPRDRQCLFAYTHSSDSLDDKIELFHPNMLVQRVRTFGWQSPKPRSEEFASGALKVIRIRNAHNVRWTPREIVGRDQPIAFEYFHILANVDVSRRLRGADAAPR